MVGALQATQVGSSQGIREGECDPATRVRKSLLGYGVIADPFYIAVWLIEPAAFLYRLAASNSPSLQSEVA
jgi:hypothetical protein